MRLKDEPPSLRLIALTPLIDVVFILLVFFMLASSFLDWRAVDLRLSAGSGTASTEDKVLVIHILVDGSITLDNNSVTARELEQQVAAELAEKASVPVIVRPEAGVELQRAINLLDLLKRAGAANVSLSRDP
ncbi:biopolymer transporter ExbD [Pelagibius sp. Alg239-R121]|uniref:ExbD/TolR family protein n=1 Tax=Pelagibius sp. Alg239-R121 TaxID=2993448 RepID=UPI0024A6972A|nr:biopolymer transporter ExbD [Pelagibius sp. Alg239-R121]